MLQSDAFQANSQKNTRMVNLILIFGKKYQHVKNGKIHILNVFAKKFVFEKTHTLLKREKNYTETCQI